MSWSYASAEHTLTLAHTALNAVWWYLFTLILNNTGPAIAAHHVGVALQRPVIPRLRLLHLPYYADASTRPAQ